MIDRPEETNQVRLSDLKLSAEERAMEESLRGVRPAPLSRELQAELRGLSERAAYVPGRFDRIAKLALPWACAACLALGFIVGTETGTTPSRAAPDAPHTVLVSEVQEMGPFGDAWREGGFRSEADEATRSGRDEAELPRLRNPYVSI